MTDSFSLYVHLPYCVRRCPYCDFNTYAVASIPEQRYLDALCREVTFAADLPEWHGRRISTVFFGGGTPSLFSPAGLGSLLETLDRLFGIEADAELTLEANPGSFEGSAAGRLAGFRRAGLNRISLGAQTFDATHLATLGRIHTPADTVATIEAARAGGFDNLSCDLISAIPGQTLEEWCADLEKAVAFGPEHISAYSLTYEEGTPLTGMKNAGMVRPADEDLELEMFRATRRILQAAGFAHYEISNFARPGRECRHNLAYWTWRDYLALGAGAHGFAAARHACGNPGTTACWGRRYANHRLPETYMSAKPGAWHSSEETLTREMAIAESLMVGLRLLGGISRVQFAGLFGLALEAAAPGIGHLQGMGLLVCEEDRVRLSESGLELADAVIVRIAAGASTPPASPRPAASR